MNKPTLVPLKGDKVEAPKLKKKRERIQCIEVAPDPSWFVRCTGENGKPLWFLRLSITGLQTRMFGPFATQHRGLLFLDRIIGGDLGDAMMEAHDLLREYAIPRTRFRNWGGVYPLVESELLFSLLNGAAQNCERPAQNLPTRSNTRHSKSREKLGA